MLPTAGEVASAIQTAFGRPACISAEDFRVLAGALLLCLREDDNGLRCEYSLRCEGRDVQQDIAESLANLSVQPNNPTIETLLVTFDRDEQFYEAIHALLAMTFPKTMGSPIRLNEVTPTQLDVLTRLAAADAIWRCDMSIRDRLLERGLPLERDKICKMVVLLG